MGLHFVTISDYISDKKKSFLGPVSGSTHTPLWALFSFFSSFFSFFFVFSLAFYFSFFLHFSFFFLFFWILLSFFSFSE